jgi:hypothetical protein
LANDEEYCRLYPGFIPSNPDAGKRYLDQSVKLNRSLQFLKFHVPWSARKNGERREIYFVIAQYLAILVTQKILP